jgi:predicted cupin superfamily sugar epimerase
MLLNNDNYTIHEVAQLLSMQPHPEGGYYKETYRSELQLLQPALPDCFGGKRNVSTAIYFLIGSKMFSAFHKIKSDELWHFYAGSPLHVHELNTEGNYHLIKLGLDVSDGYFPQAQVKAGVWFASECAVDNENAWSLVGCTVAPGFDFNDFVLADKAQLANEYPQHHLLIERLCRH